LALSRYPEDRTLHSHRREILKSNICFIHFSNLTTTVHSLVWITFSTFDCCKTLLDDGQSGLFTEEQMKYAHVEVQYHFVAAPMEK
jgi:hypothetical protein